MIGAMVEDVLARDRARRAAGRRRGAPRTCARSGRALVGLLAATWPRTSGACARSSTSACTATGEVNRTRSQARRMLAEMFQLFMAEPDVLPAEWYARAAARRRAAAPGWSATTSPA